MIRWRRFPEADLGEQLGALLRVVVALQEQVADGLFDVLPHLEASAEDALVDLASRVVLIYVDKIENKAECAPGSFWEN